MFMKLYLLILEEKLAMSEQLYTKLILIQYLVKSILLLLFMMLLGFYWKVLSPVPACRFLT